MYVDYYTELMKALKPISDVSNKSEGFVLTTNSDWCKANESPIFKVKLNPTKMTIDTSHSEPETTWCKVNDVKSEVKVEAPRTDYTDEFLDLLLEDLIHEKSKELDEKLKRLQEKEKKNEVKNFINEINKVEFNKPWTIVFWKDGSVSKVKCQGNEWYDPEKGLAMAIIKHMFEDTNYYNTIFKTFIPKKED